MQHNNLPIDTKLAKRIISVNELLCDSTLLIPKYQRPYKWTGKNVAQLFSDIARHQKKSSYRLGTVVLHADGKHKNIVDGQQRTITLILAVQALLRLRKNGLARTDLKLKLDGLEQKMVNPSFDNDVSKLNVRNNYLEISRIVSREDFTEELIGFLLNQCTVVTFTLNDVSEAFQFFDSQNARGRDLDPHDLLKAYHLREFTAEENRLKEKTVKRWEDSDNKELQALFSQYLYLIRNWSRGRSARYFEKSEIGVFKGVNIATAGSYPYLKSYRLVHNFVDQHNQQCSQERPDGAMDFPFSLDQIVINGRRFFEMVTHYQGQAKQVCNDVNKLYMLAGNASLSGHARKILDVLEKYPGRKREGDKYVRIIFDCLLIHYIDRFGFANFPRVIEKAFIWAYSLRLGMEAVQIASMDNYVRENNLFRLLREATDPSELLNYDLLPVSKNRSSKTNAVEDLFREMNYLNG